MLLLAGNLTSDICSTRFSIEIKTVASFISIWLDFLVRLIIVLLNRWSLLFKDRLRIITKDISLVIEVVVFSFLANTCSTIYWLFFVILNINSSWCIFHRWSCKEPSCCKSLLRHSALRPCWFFLTRSWASTRKCKWISLIYCRSCTTRAFLSLRCSCLGLFKEELLDKILYLRLIFDF